MQIIKKPTNSTSTPQPCNNVTSKNVISHVTRGNALNQGLSNGTDQAVTYRTRHKAMDGFANPQAVFGNFYSSNGDINGVNDIYVEASLEKLDGTIYPWTFEGKYGITIGQGGLVVSDHIGIELSENEEFFVRTHVSVTTAGQKYPVGLTCYPANGEGKTQGNITKSGAATTSFEFAYSPITILGTNTNSDSSVLLIGDSIMSGQADDTGDKGFAVRALISAGIGHIRLSKPGERAQHFQGIGRFHRMKLSMYATHAIINYGVNDLGGGRTLAQVQADLQNIWIALTLRGIKVFQTTITPRTTSTDSFATTTNQTKVGGQLETDRIALNDWLRTVPSPLTGVFDVADAVETARNSGIWIAGYTGDGTHPNATGYAAMSPKIDSNKLLI
jgi:lysophospholipase L1-like esterase